MASFFSVFIDISGAAQARWLCVLGLVLVGVSRAQCEYKSTYTIYSAIVNITYKDPKTGEMLTLEEDSGRYGTGSRKDSEWGWVVHVRTTDNKTHGCTVPVNVPNTRWIALIERGACKFHEKIHNAAVIQNASAVVIYNDKDELDLLTMEHKGERPVLMFIEFGMFQSEIS